MFARIVLVVSLLASFGVAALAQPVASIPLRPEKLPYSPGVLVARAIHAGTMHLPTRAAPREFARGGLNCTHVPCAFPMTQASTGSLPVVETPIAIDPTNANNLIVGGYDFNCAASLQGFYVSNDGGKTWNGQCGGLVSGANGGDGEPIVGVDLNGVMYGGGIETDASGTLDVAVARSTDHGQTWSGLVVSTDLQRMNSDAPALGIDTNPSSPYVNQIYVSSTQIEPQSNNTTIYVATSADGGSTFTAVPASPLARFPSLNQFSNLAAGKDGTVYLTYMNCTSGGADKDCGGAKATMYLVKSTDGGRLWSKPVAMGTAVLAPDACDCAYFGSLPNTIAPVSNIPVIGIDNSSGAHGGSLYFVDYNWTGAYMQVQVAASVDGGDTWSAPVAVAPNTDTHDQFFPWLNVSSKGLVGVTWMDRRNDPDNLSYEEFGAFSNNGGTTFGTNIQLASKPSNPDNDGFGGGFLGEYSGNGWFGRRLVAAWTDTSNGAVAVAEVGGLKQ
jgi:hypothetical protein